MRGSRRDIERMLIRYAAEALGTTPFGMRIIFLRKLRKLTQRELASQIGTGLQYVTAAEAGKVRVRASMRAKFAKALGVTSADLLG